MTHQQAYSQLVDSLRGIGIHLMTSLVYDKRIVTAAAKLDTGAEFCLFERRVADRLGIEVERGYPERLRSLTGSFTAYGHEVTLVTCDLAFDLIVYFPVDEMITRKLLGRNWLRLVRMGFVDEEGKLYLSPYEEDEP